MINKSKFKNWKKKWKLLQDEQPFCQFFDLKPFKLERKAQLINLKSNFSFQYNNSIFSDFQYFSIWGSKGRYPTLHSFILVPKHFDTGMNTLLLLSYREYWNPYNVSDVSKHEWAKTPMGAVHHTTFTYNFFEIFCKFFLFKLLHRKPKKPRSKGGSGPKYNNTLMYPF